MSCLAGPSALLGWLGRHGALAIALSVFVGLALPPLAALLKPLFTPALVMLLTLAFLRVDPAALRALVAKPGPVILATGWIMLLLPIAIGGALALTGLAERSPELYLGLILQSAAPPIVSLSLIHI